VAHDGSESPIFNCIGGVKDALWKRASDIRATNVFPQNKMKHWGRV